VLTNHTITESTDASTTAGGIPGAASNNGSGVPTYQGGAGGGTITKNDTETTYQLNKTTQKTVRAPGAVTRLSVAVVLDDDPTNPNTALVQSVQNAVNAAAGIDPSRGDILTVTSLPFNRQDALAEQAAMNDALQKAQLMGYLRLAALALGPLLMLLLLFFILKRGRRKAAAEDVAAPPPSGASVEPATPIAPPVAPRKAPNGTPLAPPMGEDPQKAYIREQIQLLGRSNPATIAQLIQTWMDEDRRN
jgi:flagellar M-ring protein FliF